jgi:DNA invertase Pin-like site-specific DNA recombinase
MTTGRRVGYRRVSTVDPNTAHQLEGQTLDEVFEDKASGKNANRPALGAMLKHLHRGDTIVCHSLDRPARNLEELRVFVLGLTKRGVRIEFLKEGLTFSGDDNAMSKFLLSIMDAFAECERSLILERKREGIAIARTGSKYKARKAKLASDKTMELQKRVAAGESKSALAREYGVSRQTIYTYLRRM